MKLYYSPGACSLADHIAMHEAEMQFDRVRVDLKTKTTETGQKFDEINPKSYVPTLEFDDGQRLTENVAILSWVAQRKPSLAPSGELGTTRLIEMLAFISTDFTNNSAAYSSRRRMRKRMPRARKSASVSSSYRQCLKATICSAQKRASRTPICSPCFYGRTK